MSVPKILAKYDKSGYKNFLAQMKFILFGDSRIYMTQRRCEEFFDDDKNFDLGTECMEETMIWSFTHDRMIVGAKSGLNGLGAFNYDIGNGLGAFNYDIGNGLGAFNYDIGSGFKPFCRCWFLCLLQHWRFFLRRPLR